ncbi:MAG: CvpA family protein [Calditrichia bacterium]|nr:CvpA family protein [Calditrichia bacterium]
MSAFDIIFIAILGFFTVLGIWKGFFREILGFVGVVLGAFLAILGFGPVSKIFHRLVPEIPSVIWVFLSFLLIFIAVYLLSRLLAGILSKLSKMVLLGWLNRLLGGIVGALKGAIFISLFLLLLGFLPFQNALQNVRNDSLFYQPLQRFVPLVYNLFSDFSLSSRNLEEQLAHLWEDLQGKLSENAVKYFFYEDD